MYLYSRCNNARHVFCYAADKAENPNPLSRTGFWRGHVFSHYAATAFLQKASSGDQRWQLCTIFLNIPKTERRSQRPEKKQKNNIFDYLKPLYCSFIIPYPTCIMHHHASSSIIIHITYHSSFIIHHSPFIIHHSSFIIPQPGTALDCKQFIHSVVNLFAFGSRWGSS